MSRENYDIILRAQNATQAAFRQLRGDLRSVQSAAAGFAGVLGRGFAPLAGGLGMASAISGIRNAATELAKLNDEAKRVGTSTDNMQALQVTLERNGGEADLAARALERFGAEAAKAANGGTSILARVLTDNNVALRDHSGNIRDSATLLSDYARLVANAGSQQEKLALASEAFGRQAGPKMVEALEQISHVGLPALVEAGKSAGDIIEKELIERAAKLDNAFKDLERRATTSMKSLAIDAAPLLISALEGVQMTVAKIRLDFQLLSQMRFGDFFMPDPVSRAKQRMTIGMGHQTSKSDFAEFDNLFGFKDPAAPAASGRRTDTSGLGGASVSREKNRTAEILASLEAQGKQLTFNLDVRRQYELVEEQINLVKRAGVDASQADKEAIRGAAAALHEKKIAFEDAQAAAAALSDVVGSIFDIMTSDADNAGEAVKRLIRDLLLAEAKASLLRMIDPSAKAGPRSTILKGFGSIAPFGGFRADGGPGKAGRAYMTGERGREIFVPDSDGTFYPEARGKAGRGPSVTNIKNFNFAPGMSPGDMARVQSLVDHAVAAGESRTIARIRTELQTDGRYLHG